MEVLIVQMGLYASLIFEYFRRRTSLKLNLRIIKFSAYIFAHNLLGEVLILGQIDGDEIRHWLILFFILNSIANFEWIVKVVTPIILGKENCWGYSFA